MRAIAFAGNPGLTADDLLSILGLSTGDILDLDRLKQGVEALRARYREEGYYQARVGQPEVLFDETEQARILLPVSAGLPIEFAFQGNAMFSSAELKKLLNYTGAERLDESHREELAQRLENAYRLIGFADARVTSSFRLLRDQRRGVVFFHIEE
ncbi:MAG: polymerase, partial [Myxococcaceae bacterium]|nr:polymerase [Myxococcaceae bacterium]